MEVDKWLVTLCNPMGYVTYNLGTVTDAEHLNLWDQLTAIELENKTSQLLLANELKKTVHRFIKKYDKKKNQHKKYKSTK